MFLPFTLLSKVIQDHPGGRSDTNSSLMAITPWCPHLLRLCVQPGRLCVQPGPIVTTRICLGWQVVCMLGGSHATVPNSRIFEEVSRLVAAPRRPSSYRVHCFVHWTAGQGIDPLGQTAAQIATFLYYLFDNQGLSP